MDMIEVDVRKSYGNFTLNAKFKASGIIGITGKNGSGKTTLLNIIAGIVKPDLGYVKVNSIDVTNLDISKRNIIFINQDSYIPTLKVMDHLLWGFKVRSMKVDKDKVNEVAKALGVPLNDSDKKVAKLSLGNRIRVALATALLVKPSVVLVDEAFSNIDNKEEFMKAVFTICKREGIDLVFTTQDSHEVMLGNNSYKIEKGTLLEL